jgi:tetratricopeptide (TPR) repeat protein
MLWAAASSRIAGRVVSSSGEPLREAVITIRSDQISGFEKVVKVKKDASFSILLLDGTKTYIFLVEAAGYVPHQQSIKVAAGSTDNFFTFTLTTEAAMQAQERADILEQPGYKEMEAGRLLLEEGKIAEAEVQLQAAVEALPDLLPAWTALAEIAYERKDHAAALERARTCLELDDESSRCLAIAVNSSQRLGDDAGREAYMARYQALNPEDPSALFNQAAEHLNKMDDEAARPLLEQCLQADPDFPKCLFEYGMLLLRSGDMEGSKAQLQHYLEVAPDGEDAATAQETIKYL